VDHHGGLIAAEDQPLVGAFFHENGHERVIYFREGDAPASTPASIRRALDLAGAWDDAEWGSWEETEAALDRIRHESRPTPPITDL
jgi:hypothetical protein